MIDKLPLEIKNDIMSRLDTIGVSGNMLASTNRDLRQVAINPWTIALWLMRWYQANEASDGLSWAFQRHVENVFSEGQNDRRFWRMETDVLTLLVLHHLDGTFRIAYRHLLCWVTASRKSHLLLRLLHNDTLRLPTEHAPALLLAAENDDVDMSTILIDHGTAARGQCDDDMPLQVAAESGSDGVVRLLLQRLGDGVLIPTLAWVPPPLLLAAGTTDTSVGRHRVMLRLLNAHVTRAAVMGAPVRAAQSNEPSSAQPWSADAWRRSWCLACGRDVLHRALSIVASSGPFRGGDGDSFFVRIILDIMRLRGGCDVPSQALSLAGRVNPDVVMECLIDACSVRGCSTESSGDSAATLLLQELRGSAGEDCHMTDVWYERAVLVSCKAHRTRFVNVLLAAYEVDLPDASGPISTTDALERSYTDVVWQIRCNTIAAAAHHCRLDGDVSQMSRLLARCVNEETDAQLQWPARALHLALYDALIISCRRCDLNNVTLLLPGIQAFGTVNDVLLANALRIVVSNVTATAIRPDDERRCRCMAIFLMLVAAGGESDYMTVGDDDDGDGPLAFREHSPLTLLSIAVSRDNDFVARTLLFSGADPLANDAQAVVIALSEGNLKMCRMLVKCANDAIADADEVKRRMLRPAVQAAYNASRHVRDAEIMQAVAMMHRRLDAPLTSSLAPHQ